MPATEPIPPQPASRRTPILVLTVLVEGGAIALAAGLGWWFGVPLWPKLTFTPHDAAVGLAATGPMLVALLLTTHFPVGPIKGVQEFLDQVVLPLFEDCTLLDLLLISVLAGIGEELLFRGVLQDSLVDGWGAAAGVAVASLVFGLAHCVTLGYFLLTFVFGAYLGLVRLWCDSLSAAILAHGLYDFLALVYLLRVRKPGAEVDVRMDQGMSRGEG